MPSKIIRLPTKKAAPAKAPAKKVAAKAPVATPGDSKAQQFALRAEAAGWTVERRADPPTKRAICVRGDETVEVGWTNEVADGPIGYHVHSAGTTSIKNAASALRIIEGKPGEFIPSPKARAIRAQTKPKAERVAKPLPFDPYKTLDEDVIAAVRGKRVVWINSLDSDNPCEARVPNAPRPQHTLPSGKLSKKKFDHTFISLSKDEDTLGERILNFCDPGVGFRACHVGAIIRVGGE